MDFLKNNKRFSFLYGGQNAFELEFEKTAEEKENELVTTYIFKDGLKITNITKKYPKYDAYEWVNYIENTSDTPSGIISELWDCDCSFPIEHESPRKWEAYFPHIDTATKVYSPSGSTWTKDEFYCNVDAIKDNQRINHIYPGEVKTYSASDGRSSEKKAPFFNIHKNGKGYIFAIGWTGQWNCEVIRGEDDITIKTKIEDTNFKVLPGEKFRTS